MSNTKKPSAPTPRNPVARAAQTVAKGSGRHANKKRASQIGQTKHKGKMMDSVSALDSRLITETLLIMEEFDIFEDDGVAASPRLQRAHEKERQRRGLPDPDYYLKLKRQKEAEIAAMKAQDEADKKVSEVSEWGDSEELLSDVMTALEREVEWPLTEIMDTAEVQELLQPLRDAINSKIKSLDQGASKNELEDIDEEFEKLIDENWRKKLAAAGMAGMMGIGGAAGAADKAPDPATDKYNFTDTSLEFPDPARKKLMPRTPVKDLNPVDRYELDRKMGRFSGSYGEWLKANQNNSGR